MKPTPWEQIAALIDYADLRVDTRERDLRLLCLEAEKFGIPTVVVNPVNVTMTAGFARESKVKVAAAVSYPVGAYWPDAKADEIADAVADGADEIYMLMSVGRFLDERIEEQTIPELAALFREAQGRPTKLITEASVLTPEQKRTLCRLAIDAHIDYLVTSADFSRSHLPPVTLEDIRILVEAAGSNLGIIYHGDIAGVQQAKELLDAGVTRFSTASARALLASCEGFPGQP
jgi:deoxyribose-phosphate aldolase